MTGELRDGKIEALIKPPGLRGRLIQSRGSLRGGSAGSEPGHQAQDRRLINRGERRELLSAAENSSVGNTVTVRLIGFNDFHGTLLSPGTFGINLNVPPAQRPAVGGAEFIAGHVDKLKAQNPLNLVVGAGDTVIELANEGTDTVQTTVSTTLGDNLET